MIRGDQRKARKQSICRPTAGPIIQNTHSSKSNVAGGFSGGSSRLHSSQSSTIEHHNKRPSKANSFLSVELHWKSPFWSISNSTFMSPSHFVAKRITILSRAVTSFRVFSSYRVTTGKLGKRANTNGTFDHSTSGMPTSLRIFMLFAKVQISGKNQYVVCMSCACFIQFDRVFENLL